MIDLNYSDLDEVPERMAQTCIRLPEDQLAGLREIANSEERNVSSVMRHAIRLYLEAYAEQSK